MGTMSATSWGWARQYDLRVARAVAAFGTGIVAALIVVLAPDIATARPADDKVFTIANYPVQAKAANAVAAKEQAIAEGQKAAFRSLLKRLVPVTAYSRLKALKESDPQVLVDGFVVRSERNSTTEYIANLDFSFRADAVRNLLRREAVPFIEEQAPEVVLVAAVREGGKLARSGSIANAWRDIWRDLDLKNALTPLKLAEIKPFVHDDTLNMLVAGDESANRVLASEYGGGSVVVAIAEVDQPAGRVHVTLAGRDAVGPFNLKRSYRLYDDDAGYAMELAAVVSMGIIEGRWKTMKAQRYGGMAALATGGEPVRLQAEFQGLAEWRDLHTRVRETPGVSDVQVDAVSARGADLQLNFPGGGPALADALAARGLSLRNIGGNWYLRPSF